MAKRIDVERRYHKDIFIPQVLNFQEFWGRINELHLTEHFKQRSIEKNIPAPKLAELKQGELFEVYTMFSEIDKVVVKIRGEKLDVCYVISKCGSVVTAWWREKGNEMKDYWLYDIE